MWPRRRRARRADDGPLRVAYLTPTLQPGGAERQMTILARGLPRDLFEVRFILLVERGPLAEEVEDAGVRVDTLGIRREACASMGPRCLSVAARGLRRYASIAAHVDIVDAWLLPSMMLAAVGQPVARVPVVLGGRRSLSDVYRDKSWVRRYAASAAARRMDAIVANSHAAAAEATALDRVDPARVRVIPNAVLEPPDVPGARDRQRTQWGVSGEDLVVGCVANYKPGKGLEMLIDVAGRLRERHPRLRFVLVGEGPLRASLEERISRHDLGSMVTLHGGLPDARPIYPAFDVLVQVSETEGLPNVVLEGAAAGLPIVATGVGGTAEIVTDGRDAILVPSGDPEAMSSALDRLASDSGLRAGLGLAARARAGAFSPERLIEATAAFYLRLAGRSDAGASSVV